MEARRSPFERLDSVYAFSSGSPQDPAVFLSSIKLTLLDNKYDSMATLEFCCGDMAYICFPDLFPSPHQ